ncbi:MAG: recombination regulator RecX [Nitrospiraceae bacterium]|nr:recombination regulator RecX [Nitrospiraceae bacterium]
MSKSAEASGMQAALKYSIKLLAYRDRSEKELLEKIVGRGFSGAEASGAIDYLRQKGFINDRQLADSLIRDGISRKCLGRRGLIAYLQKRGIPSDIIEDRLGSEGDNLDAALDIAKRRLLRMSGLDADTIRRRLAGLLSRRGFSYATVKTVFGKIKLKEDYS